MGHRPEQVLKMHVTALTSSRPILATLPPFPRLIPMGLKESWYPVVGCLKSEKAELHYVYNMLEPGKSGQLCLWVLLDNGPI